MTYLTENISSKGFIVASIDHNKSTFRDASCFQSTLLNRLKDIHNVLNELINLSNNTNHFLGTKIEENKIGIVGYSIGGYGVLNVTSAGYRENANNFFKRMTDGSTVFESLTTLNKVYISSFDPKINAVVALAPWGKNVGVWGSIGLAGLKIPTFIIAGNEDDVSGYENDIKAIYDGAINVERYLLPYDNARHNVAPNPPAPETMAPGLHYEEYYRYAEPAWDERMINNINQHFITAFLGVKLKGLTYEKYLDLPPNSNEKT